jgi:hypothetical protein
VRRAVVLVAWLAACGSGSDRRSIPDAAMAADANGIDAAPPRELVSTSQPLQVGELVEGIMHGGPDDLALLHLEAPAGSLSWNLHSHQGGGTQVVYEELNKTTVDYQFVPAFGADWYLLLRNDGATDVNVKVTIGLYGAMTWKWQ